MKRDALLVLYLRGFVAACATWKALLLVLGLNALLAFVATGPLASALAETLDRNPEASRLVSEELATFFRHFTRARPDVLGETGRLEDLLSGQRVSGSLFDLAGVSGTTVALALVSAAFASLLAGGFAGRFGAERDAASLSAFGADVGRFAFSSLSLGVVQLAGLVLLYKGLYIWPAGLYREDDLTYEWEAVALTLVRLAAFLLAAGLLRAVVVAARASIGRTRNGSPLTALVAGAGFVAGRPFRSLILQGAFLASAAVALLAARALAPAWDGRDAAGFGLSLLPQVLVVAFLALCRVGHLGATSAWMQRLALARQPAPDLIEPPAA